MRARAHLYQRLTYGVGSIGTGIFTTVPSVLLLFFLTTVARIDVAIAGVIILIPKAAGLIGDPLIGAWADHVRRRWPVGRKIGMSIGAVLAGAGLWALFTTPQLHPGNVLIPGLIYFACTTGYSFFAVPYAALPAELDEHPDGRRALVSTRLGISFLGTLVGGVGAPLIAARAGYPIMAIAVGVASFVAMGAFLLTCRLAKGPVAPRQIEVPEGDRSAIASKPFMIQMAAFVLLLASAGAFAALLPFLVRDMGASADVVGLAMLVDIVVALLTSMLWPVLIRHFGLRIVWQLAGAVTCLSALIVGLAPSADYRFYLGMAVGGAGLSGVQIAGFTGLADLSAQYLGRGRGAGLITGFWMAGEKAGLATGPLLAGFGLKFLGNTVLGAAARSSMALIPAILAVIAMAVIAFDPTGARSITTKPNSKPKRATS